MLAHAKPSEKSAVAQTDLPHEEAGTNQADSSKSKSAEAVTANQPEVSKPQETKTSTQPRNFDVSKTALPVVGLRHGTSQVSFWESRNRGNRKQPLTRGEHALLFVSPEEIKAIYTRKDVDKVQTVGVRARYMNKVYQTYIKEHGFKQVIILGSGYDTRPYKKNAASQAVKANANTERGKANAEKYAQVKFFEVDKASLLDDKEKKFTDAHIDKNATYVRADYTEADFINKLKAAGVDVTAATVFIWEGNVMYLEKEQVTSVMQTLKTNFPRFVMTFDYFSQALVDKVNNGIWKTGIDDIQAFAKQHELRLIDQRTMADLAKANEYDVDHNPPPETEQYSVCSLSSVPKPF